MSGAKTQGGNKMQEIYGLPPKAWKKLTHREQRERIEMWDRVKRIENERCPQLGGRVAAQFFNERDRLNGNV
jgi:hypothetical protein